LGRLDKLPLCITACKHGLQHILPIASMI
jgi:hypothetical protein